MAKPPKELIQRRTTLSQNLIGFARFLRGKGFSVGPAEITDALEALTHVSWEDPSYFRLTLKAVLARSRQQQERFDNLYRDYWRELERAVDSKVREQMEASAEKKPAKGQETPNQPPPVMMLKDWLKGQEQQDEMALAAYSADSVLSQRDFSTFSPDELQEITQIIQAMARLLARRYSRRYRHHPRHGQLDLRRTLRRNVRQGSEMMHLAFRRRPRRRIKLVMLCDVSKSMDLYSRFLVQFVYAFQQAYSRIETFVFASLLHRISDQLQERDYHTALEQLSQAVPDWSGGTRIGASLHSFIEDYGRRLLDPNTLVLILSDGWDTGDIETLEESMSFIHRKSGGVIWLNPLAGHADFKPEAGGMQAAWPYIDIFASAHNLASLREVLTHLRRLERGRLISPQAGPSA